MLRLATREFMGVWHLEPLHHKAMSRSHVLVARIPQNLDAHWCPDRGTQDQVFSEGRLGREGKGSKGKARGDGVSTYP